MNNQRRLEIAMWVLCLIAFLVFLVAFSKEPQDKGNEETKCVAEIETTAETTEETTVEGTETTAAETTAAEPAETVTETTAETAPEKTTYYDSVPLDADLQGYIILKCEAAGISPATIFAIIERESSYRANIRGDNGRSYGLMQIQLRWHSERMEKLGCTDLLNPYDNVTVGIDYLSDLVKYYGGDMGTALTAYNGGYAYANKLKAKGAISKYAKGVLIAANEILEEEA